MIKAKKLSLKKILTAVLAPAAVGAAVVGAALTSETAKAISSYPTQTTITNPIYDFDGYHYDESSLNQLAEAILGSQTNYTGTTKTFTDLINYAKNKCLTSGRAIENKTITLQYGRYRNSFDDPYSSLIWMPTYLSTTSDGSSAVLTLYLATANGPISSQEYSGYSFDAKSTTSTSSLTPANMYGTSFIRAKALGNGGTYGTYSTTQGSTVTINKPSYEEQHKYGDFLEYIYTTGEGDNAKKETRQGYLYDDIVTPSQLSWQATESYKKYVGATAAIKYNDADYDATTWANYYWPNEAYGVPSEGSCYLPNYFDYGGGSQANKVNYDIWKNDKVWLPSLTEVGTGDGSSLNGMWQLTKEQRANSDGGFSLMAAKPTAWLRTANTAYPEQTVGSDNFSTSHIFVLEQDGSVGFRKLDGSSDAKNFAVRPAIHLNLSKAKEKIKPPVILGDTVYATYNGAEHKLQAGSVTLAPDQSSWFVPEDMNVRFAYDREFTKLANPIDAGKYFMEVTLENTSAYFVGTSAKRKIVNFVIEKAKVGVKWTVVNNIPVSVDFVPGTTFYQRDVSSGNTPKIGIEYESYAVAGLRFYDFDELLRGDYYAKARIIDEDLYKYNYQLADNYNLGDPVKLDKSFSVGRKIIELPAIANAGEGKPDPKNNNVLTYRTNYQGDRYIQLENVSKYLLVSVEGKTGGKIECLNDKQKVEVNGVQKEFPVVSSSGTLTYKISAVDAFVFTFSFKDQERYTWKGTYSFNTDGTESGAQFEDRFINLEIARGIVDAEFVGLPGEWVSILPQEFTITLRGIYEHLEGVEIPLSVTCANNSQGTVQVLKPENGKYTLSLDPGDYTLSVGFINSADNKYNQLYMFPSGRKSQNFKVLVAESKFNDNVVQWQYTHKGVTAAAGGYIDHDTQASAFVFDYDGDDYVFSLTIGENELRETYYAKAEYSGAKFVRDAGMHSITVDIKPYTKGVRIEEKSYTLYFKINPVKYDLSGLKWDYDPDKHFAYDGTEHKVRLTAESLGALAGLTAGDYSTNGNGKDAGNYRTGVSFLVSAEHAKNYVLPAAENANSYDGTFVFYCDWTVDKAKLTVEWLIPDAASSSVLVTPVLKNGAEYVTYTYERRVSDSRWETATSLTAAGSAETFRAIAVLKSQYAGNYELENNSPCEFTVESGKRAVTIHFEANGEICLDGAEFKYSGSPVKLELKIDSAGSINAYEFEYYKVGEGGARTKLTKAPSDVGKYVAAVTARYNIDSFITDNCESEVSFSIVKGDYDANQIYWMYVHGDKVVAGKYDSAQGKYVDDSGKEVEFSFEYDGTPHVLKVLCQQVFTDVPENTLAVTKLQGASQINAGTYTAAVDFNYDGVRAERFNDPHSIFPRTLEWTITKKKIDYNNVRWGYIAKNGEEKDFDFENDAFRYTRDENGPVGYTVALIGLPKGVQNLMVYATKNLSVTGAPVSNGNTRTAIGEYLTAFAFESGAKWTDPNGNHEDFDASTFPLSIHTSQAWKINRRELSRIDYDGSWAKFDDRVHDVLELCGIPYDEYNYINVEITFIDNAFTVINGYEGYNGTAHSLYHAGTYDVKIYEKQTVWKNGAEVEEVQVWDVLTLSVKKAELKVSWDLKGAYPIAFAESVFATDMVTTVYKRDNGVEVPIAYIKSTNNDETFLAAAKITDNYLNDITIVMAPNQPKEQSFTYAPFKPQTGAKELEFPKISINEKFFTGSPLTFEVDAWEATYKNYLYVSMGSLTQTDVGEYNVVLRFKKEANAYWKQGSGIGEYNREAVTLKFTIKPPKEWALAYPVLDKTFADWTGEEIEFKIVNWVALSKYLSYEVFYKGESLGDNLKVKRGGLYTIKFRFPEGSIGYWKADHSHSEYVLQFTIEGDPNAPVNEEIPYPNFVKTTAVFNGSPIQFVVENWDTYYQNYLIIDGAGVDIKNGVVTATNAGSYVITFKFKEGLSNTFEGGETTYTLTVAITANPELETPLKKPQLNATEQELQGQYVEFSINGWASAYREYLIISSDNSSVEINSVFGIVRVKDSGTYSITLTFKEGANAYWEGADKSKAPVKLEFTVTKPSLSSDKSYKPTISGASRQYTGGDIKFYLSEYDPSKVTASGCEVKSDDKGYFVVAKDIGSYTITFALKSGVSWDDGSTENISCNFEIIKLTINDIGVGADGNPVITDGNGNKISGDLGGLIKTEYYDKDGNKVDKDKLVSGERYTVRLIVEDRDSFKDKVSNGGDILDRIDGKNNENDGKGGFVIESYQPSADGKNDGEGGFNPLWWIAIAAAILAVIAIIGIIIGLATRNRSEIVDDYDDGYDDYGDEDDYDDDDDDDDDYDEDEEDDYY